jgi:hypothetical protein
MLQVSCYESGSDDNTCFNSMTPMSQLGTCPIECFLYVVGNSGNPEQLSSFVKHTHTSCQNYSYVISLCTGLIPNAIKKFSQNLWTLNIMQNLTFCSHNCTRLPPKLMSKNVLISLRDVIMSA